MLIEFSVAASGVHSSSEADISRSTSRIQRAILSVTDKTGLVEFARQLSFNSFVQKKTQEIRKQYGCQDVEFSVELTDGHVKLKAKAKA